MGIVDTSRHYMPPVANQLFMYLYSRVPYGGPWGSYSTTKLWLGCSRRPGLPYRPFTYGGRSKTPTPLGSAFKSEVNAHLSNTGKNLALTPDGLSGGAWLRSHEVDWRVVIVLLYCAGL